MRLQAIYRSLEGFPQILARSSTKRRLANTAIGFVLLNVIALISMVLAYLFQYLSAIDPNSIGIISALLLAFSVTHLSLIEMTTYRLKKAFAPCFSRLQHCCPLFDTNISQVALLELIKVQTDYLGQIAAGIANSNTILQTIDARITTKVANPMQATYLPTLHESVLDPAKLQERPRVHIENRDKKTGSSSNHSMSKDPNPVMLDRIKETFTR